MKKRLTYVLGGLLLMVAFFMQSCTRPQFPADRTSAPTLTVEGSYKIGTGAYQPLKISAGAGNSFSNTYVSDTPMNGDTVLRYFVFEMYEIDADNKPISTLKFILNNHAFKTGDPLKDLQATLDNSVSYAFTPSNQDFKFVPNQIRVHYNNPSVNPATFQSDFFNNTAKEFKIVRVEPYVFEGKNYLMCDVEFSCELHEYATDGHIVMNNFKGSIALAY